MAIAKVARSIHDACLMLMLLGPVLLAYGCGTNTGSRVDATTDGRAVVVVDSGLDAHPAGERSPEVVVPDAKREDIAVDQQRSDTVEGPDVAMAEVPSSDLAPPDVPGSDDMAVDVAAKPDRVVAVDLTAPDRPPQEGGVSETNPALCHYLAGRGWLSPPSFDFVVTLPGGDTQSCTTKPAIDGGTAMPYWTAPITSEITGRVTAVSATELSVDTCDAGAGCSSTVYQFSVQAPGLAVTVPVGRRVSVWWWLFNGGWSCGRVLAISDAAAVDAGNGTSAPLWLAGSDSVVQQPLPVPFTVARRELFCNPSSSVTQGCGGNDVPPDDYAFMFTPRSGDASLALATGESGTLALPVGSGALQHLAIHNLRSYQTMGCDDYWNWAWWATGRATAGGQPE
jgi:hypothetical protein